MRAILSVLLLFGSQSAGVAQSYSANGHVGYLQEWELSGSLAKTTTRGGADYAGPVALRHVGLCSANGVEEKTASIQLKISPSRLEGSLVMDGDDCHIAASGSASFTGLLRCRNGQDVPINLSIDAGTEAKGNSEASTRR